MRADRSLGGDFFRQAGGRHCHRGPAQRPRRLPVKCRCRSGPICSSRPPLWRPRSCGALRRPRRPADLLLRAARRCLRPQRSATRLAKPMQWRVAMILLHLGGAAGSSTTRHSAARMICAHRSPLLSSCRDRHPTLFIALVFAARSGDVPYREDKPSHFPWISVICTGVAALTGGILGEKVALGVLARGTATNTDTALVKLSLLIEGVCIITVSLGFLLAPLLHQRPFSKAKRVGFGIGVVVLPIFLWYCSSYHRCTDRPRHRVALRA